ncbi:hypothetical protein BDN72DRAFT_899202 [Pluteus cervinus]|uniref:Uncharacterized protein n=1 Tax=Pluteus cervinus TaxID=181527 RepID=A0ACD3ANU7_9AGAR|nr:hypothetical protein BDN72DRAFT_899202 [Pluteus cervinus]
MPKSSSSAGSDGSIVLPGLGLPLDVYQAADSNIRKFANALGHAWDAEVSFIPLREFTMMRLMNEMTDKIAWEEKIMNPEIAARWREEALNTPDTDITQAMVNWCMAEVQYKAEMLKKTNAVVVFTGDVVKSDTIVPDSVRLALVDAVKPLEDIPERMKDWHPRSNGTVLDLVHPSLFPVVYERTRALSYGGTTLEDCIALSGAGETLGTPEFLEDSEYESETGDVDIHEPFSSKFQWLPCEVDFSNGQTKITSYINNLHPHHHKHLYQLIEQIIGYAVPLWDITLTPQRKGYEHRIDYGSCEYEPKAPPDEEDRDEYWRKWEEWVEVREVILPDPGIFVPLPSFDDLDLKTNSEGRVRLREEFGKEGIQVIVKLANILLTPENPEYGGGTWHVEGQLNEHICASAIHYYSSSNITTSRLSFRQRVHHSYDDMNIGHGQDEKEWLSAVFGCEDETGEPIQDIGSVETREGRLITFPNHLQHKVEAFRLEDPTQPGYRKILALFLVDPQTRILSSRNIPCQRLDWWAEAIGNAGAKDTALDPFSRLPAEVQGQIFDKVEDFPISLDEAKILRLELMDERSIFGETQRVIKIAAYSP